MRRWAGLAVAVVAAMALGRVITDHVPVDGAAEGPFVRTGEVGRPVALSYADVEVTGVRAGPHLYGAEPVAAAGQFLLVDLRLVARERSTTFLGFALLDRSGRRFLPDSRGATCPTNTTAPAGVPWYAVLCFDVPPSALRGATLVVARGDYGVNGSGQRRDDQAHIDLGLDAARAKELAASTQAWKGQFPGLDPVDTDPVKEGPVKEAPGEEAP